MPLRAQALPVPVPAAGTARAQVSWIDPDGNNWDLSDLTMTKGIIATALQGYGGPGVAYTTLPLPSGNAIPQTLMPQPPTITLGLYAEGLDPSAFHTLRSQITRAFWTLRSGLPAPGTLQVSQPDGTSRQIQLYCTGGLDQTSNSYLTLQEIWSLTLNAQQPYWSDTEAQPPLVFTLPPSDVGVPPMPPVTLGTGNALGSATVTNDGDADAYPVWVVTGPGQPTITNNTTGREWSLSTDLSAGDVWTVTTAPDGTASVIDQNGASQWSSLVAGIPRDLWPLVPGTNDLTIDLGGSATAASSVSMQFTRQWLRA